jgi:hypothetical protein
MEPQEERLAAASVPEPGQRSPAPWEDPEAPILAGLFRTLREVLFRPGEFFEHLGGEGWAAPLAFALIVSSVGLLASCFWQFLLLLPAGGNPGDASGLSPSLGLSPGWLMALMAASPVLALVNLGVSGLCWWGSMALVGAGRDFIPAWRVCCYAQGGMALALIPVFGTLVAGIWVLALLYSGVKRFYGASTGVSLGAVAIFLTLQAVLAVTLLLGLLAALVCLSFLALVG